MSFDEYDQTDYLEDRNPAKVLRAMRGRCYGERRYCIRLSKKEIADYMNVTVRHLYNLAKQEGIDLTTCPGPQLFDFVFKHKRIRGIS